MTRAARLLSRTALLPVAALVGALLVAGCAAAEPIASSPDPSPNPSISADDAVADPTDVGTDDDETDDWNEPPICSNGTPGGGESVTREGPDGEPFELGGYVGWWNSIPADADGGVLPVDEWPEQQRERVREHPATATVFVDNRETVVLETYDRETCGPVEDYVPPTPEDLRVDAGSGGFILLLDARTGDVLEHLDAGL